MIQRGPAWSNMFQHDPAWSNSIQQGPPWSSKQNIWKIVHSNQVDTIQILFVCFSLRLQLLILAFFKFTEDKPAHITLNTIHRPTLAQHNHMVQQLAQSVSIMEAIHPVLYWCLSRTNPAPSTLLPPTHLRRWLLASVNKVCLPTCSYAPFLCLGCCC